MPMHVGLHACAQVEIRPEGSAAQDPRIQVVRVRMRAVA